MTSYRAQVHGSEETLAEFGSAPNQHHSQEIAILNNIVLAATSQERSGLGTLTGRTDLEIYNTDLSANYNMTPRDFLFTELRMNRVEYAQPLISSELYIADFYLNHGFSDKFVLGAGVAEN